MRQYIDIISEGLLGILPTNKKEVITLLAHGYDVRTVAKVCHCSEEEVMKIANDAQKNKSKWPRVK